MKIVIIGKGLMLANIILGAIDAGAEIVGVLRYEKTCTNPIKLWFEDFFRPNYELTLIRNLKLKQLNFKSANSTNIKDFLIRENVDIVFVGTWREKLKKEIFDVPKIGTINVHPSLLPKYRGPNPYMQTILHGEKCSGVTLHLVDENFDTGAILSQKTVPISDKDTSKELRERTVLYARSLVADFIKELDNHIITPIPQIKKKATYFSNISGEERMLNFEKQTSSEISRTIRALHPFLPAYITYKNKFFIVNPYEFEILDELSNEESGKIVAKNSKQASLTIVCKDKRAIKFSKLKLYKAKIFTNLYIKHFVKI